MSGKTIACASIGKSGWKYGEGVDFGISGIVTDKIPGIYRIVTDKMPTTFAP
jgi:hypothetical protein